MFDADFVLFSVAGNILVARLLWLAGVGTLHGLRPNKKDNVVREATRIVESYEARLRP